MTDNSYGAVGSEFPPHECCEEGLSTQPFNKTEEGAHALRRSKSFYDHMISGIDRKVRRQPYLHRDTVPRPYEHHERHVFERHRNETWYELFYDLIFVAIAIQLSHIIQHDISVEALFRAGIIFAVMRTTWDELMFYQNRFDTKDFLHYAFYLFQALCAFVMAGHLGVDSETGCWDYTANARPVAVAAMMTRLAQAFMYTQVAEITTNYRHHLLANTVGQLITAFVYMLSATVQYDIQYYYWFWLAAILCERYLIWIYIHLYRNPDGSPMFRLPWHFGHLIHREGTFVLLMLGEAIIQMVQDKAGGRVIDYSRRVFGFTCVFNLGNLYRQQQLVGEKHFKEAGTETPSYAWISLHLFLSLAMLFFAAGVKLVYADAHSDISFKGIEHEIYLMCVSASVALIIMYILRLQYHGLTEHGTWGRIGDVAVDYSVRYYTYFFRFFISLACLSIPSITHNSSTSVVLLFIGTSLLVLEDFVSSFLHKSAEEEDLSRHNSITDEGHGASGGGGSVGSSGKIDAHSSSIDGGRGTALKMAIAATSTDNTNTTNCTVINSSHNNTRTTPPTRAVVRPPYLQEAEEEVPVYGDQVDEMTLPLIPEAALSDGYCSS